MVATFLGDSPSMEWLIALTLIGLLAGGYATMSHLDRKRREGLAALAKELGLELNWQLPAADLARFNRFQIASKGRSPTTGTTIIADDGETRMVVFDYSYTTGHGKHKRSHLYSIAMCSNPALKLPNMSIEPETWQSKIAELVGFVDIDIAEDPAFSKRFSIQGDDPTAIRSFLNPTRRAVLSKFPDQRLSSQFDTLLVIRKYGRLKPDNVRELMTEALQITNAMVVQDQE
jgi:hypothetical protein